MLLFFFIIILGLFDLIIGGYLLLHQKTNILGITVNNSITQFAKFNGYLFVLLGILIISFNFTKLLLITISLIIISMLATLFLTFQFGTYLKQL